MRKAWKTSRRPLVWAIILPITLVVAGGIPSAFAEKSSKSANSKEASASKAESSKASDEKTTVILGDKLAIVNLSKEFQFVGEEKAKAFMKSQGSSGEGILGIIAPRKDSTEDYFVVCRFEDCGYVKDDDADKLNADEILNAYKEGTKEQNEERKEMNIPPVFVGGWAEKPHYDKAAHHVIWAIEVKDDEAKDAPVVSVNYNTRILGRRGVLSMNLVTDPKNLEADKVKVASLLSETTFKQGNTYAEYVPGKDKSAGYGIAGLILGGGALAAAAKFGVFGGLFKWGLGILLVMKKFIFVAVAGVAALVSNFFKKKPKDGEM
jgi:uncharacterized membrane-anchored protein